MRIEHWRYAIPLWFRGLFRRRAVEQELDEELHYHIEQQTAANVAMGMTPAEARRAAVVSLGGVERRKDESRDAKRLSAIDSIAQLRYTVRSLGRARAFTIATVTTIALAVAAACSVFAIVDTVLLRPLPYPESERLVGLWHSFPGIGMPLAPQAPGTYASYRKSSKSLESIAAYSGGTVTIDADDPTRSAERVGAAGVAGAIFSMLRTHPIVGRVLADADEAPGAPHVVVIGERYWRTRMDATPDVLGNQLHIGGTSYAIVGVLPASFAFPGSDVAVWLPINVAADRYLGSFGFRAIGRLRPGVSIAAAEQDLQRILNHVAEEYAEVNPGMSTTQALAKTKAFVVIHRLRDDAIGGFEHVLWLVAAIVAVLLVVAFSNVASLALARIEARQRELAIRTTLGASAVRIASSLVAEAAIVSLLGGAIGGVIAVAVIIAIGRTGPTEFPDPRFTNGGVAILPRLDEIHPDVRLALSVLGLIVAFCLLIACIGAWRVRAMNMLRTLREAGRSATAGRVSQRMRALFVVVEVALSLVLLSGSTVIGRSVLRLLDVRPGFDPEHVITFWTSPPRAGYRTAEDVARFYRDGIARVAQTRGVAAVGVVSKPPLQFAPGRRIVWVENAPPSNDALPPDYPITAASDGYFGAMGIPLLAGRDFDPASVRRGDNEAVVSRGFAVRNWNDSSGSRALGRRFRVVGNVGPWYTIVGVVGDVRDTSMAAPADAGIYLPEEPGTDSATQARTSRDMAFVVRFRGSPAGLAPALTQAIRSLDPSVPVYEMALMTETVAKANARMRFVLLLLSAGALATLALGIVGLYGVIAYLVGMRSGEIGIRIALGLTPNRATQLVLREGLVIVAAGTLVGLPVFAAFARLLRSLAFEVSVIDGTSVTAAAAVVFAVATLATWLPARRAGRIDPAVALKNE